VALRADPLIIVAMSTPEGWNIKAHDFWLLSKRQEAIGATVTAINVDPVPFPLRLGVQLGFYFSMVGDWKAAAVIFGQVNKAHPDDYEALLNHGVCLSRAGKDERAIEVLLRAVERNDRVPVAWDSLAQSNFRLGRLAEARSDGQRSLILKHAAALRRTSNWRPPGGLPSEFAHGKPSVIAFSLWGDNPRYLRGALQNVLAARVLYPDWRCRFYVDRTVPQELQKTLRELGAELILETDLMRLNNRHRLMRRFLVANDPGVGYFMVRDCDSVISAREAQAVRNWLDSERWFHVMRDWWTHTDLMLAGMWGGVAGVLPDLHQLFAEYQSGQVETPNLDQWFLRDQVWHLIYPHCLAHDRCFGALGALPFAGEEPVGSMHVGQDEFAVRREEQGALLEPWITRLACLRLPVAT